MDYNKLNRILYRLYNIIGNEKLNYKTYMLLRDIIICIEDILSEGN